MLESLKLIFQRLIENTQTDQYRFLYHLFDLNNRLIALLGPRGVGKTTLMLQLIKNYFSHPAKVFYFSADHIYFEKITLYQFVENLYLTEGTHIFFIDEIHKYKNWSQELKNLYDGFPQLQIIFSGSSTLDLVKGSHDLSRRTKVYYLPGMSLREYINFSTNAHLPAISFQVMKNDPEFLNASLPSIPMLKGYFKEYLAKGFYPFYFENPLSYHERILNIIEKTIYEDIASFYNLKTNNLHLFKKILIFLASIPPGEISTHNIAKNLSTDDKTIIHYLTILQNAGLINMVFAAEGGNQSLRRPEKLFLNNTNLYFALSGQLSANHHIGTVQELFFVQSIKNAHLNVFYNKTGDFTVDQFIFEIGGKNKTKKQIKNIDNAFIVKDDTLIAKSREIPLVFFGFFY